MSDCINFKQHLALVLDANWLTHDTIYRDTYRHNSTARERHNTEMKISTVNQ